VSAADDDCSFQAISLKMNPIMPAAQIANAARIGVTICR
jgi:hypothetical protein